MGIRRRNIDSDIVCESMHSIETSHIIFCCLLYWCVRVFADIDPLTFNIDPNSVEDLITSRTRAIVAVDIFGQSADLPALRKIADFHGLKLVTDTAQAPGAMLDGTPAGTLADIGGFSLNYHKHIHCGEGGLR